MGVLGMIVRIYSYVYHLVVALFLVGLSLVAFSTGMHNIQLEIMPWTGNTLTWALLGIGLGGILCVALAVTGILRVLFLLWTLAVLVFLIRGYVFTSYTFDGWAGFGWAAAMVAGALLAVLGGWLQFRRAPKPTTR